MRRGYAAAVLVIASVALLSVTMVSPAVSTTVDFSIYNSGWNGTSGLAVSVYRAGKLSPSMSLETTGTDVTIVHMSLEQVAPDPRTEALVVIGPTKAFTAAEGVLVGDFVRRGGVLLLADDFGTGNSLLGHMGAQSRFSGKLVMDLAFEKKPEFCVCFDFAEDPLTEGVGSLLMNYPSSVVVKNSSAEVLARSTVASWLDVDGDRLQDLGEPRGPFTLLAREPMGDGTVMLLADPSLLINGMAEHLDNAVLAGNLLSELGLLRTAVYFDESHRDYFDPLVVTSRLTGEISDRAKLAILGLSFVLLVWVSTDLLDRGISRVVRLLMALWDRTRRLLSPSKETARPKRQAGLEGLVVELSRKHPEWRPGMIRHVLREKQRHEGPAGPRQS
jgi:hypothetical protein